MLCTTMHCFWNSCGHVQGFGPYTHLQCRLLRNIGVAFLQQGTYSDARDNFEAALRIQPDMVSAYNRLIATYMITKSVEQSDALKQAFQDMLGVPGLPQAGADTGVGGTKEAQEAEVCPGLCLVGNSYATSGMFACMTSVD
jgi:tetratricopeptide (TPR) repeat protein